MRNTMKLYSFAVPAMILPFVADITVSGAWDYVRGMEFRAFAAQLLSQVFAGVADAFIIAGVSQFFAIYGS